MKRTLLCLLALLAWSTPAAPAAGSGTEIVASGSGSVSLPPNVATVNASIVTNAPAADAAVSQNNAAYDRVVSAIVKTGVARSDVTLAYYNMSYNPPPAAPAPGSTERYGYTVSRGFAVKVRAVGDAGRVSDACTSAGATSVDGVSFGLADTTAARAQATAKAFAQAQADAGAMAQAAGLHVVAIRRIELLSGPSGPTPMMRMAAAPSPATQFDQGDVSVTVSLSVVFLAQP